jgi:hypothetical protein
MKRTAQAKEGPSILRIAYPKGWRRRDVREIQIAFQFGKELESLDSTFFDSV